MAARKKARKAAKKKAAKKRTARKTTRKAVKRKSPKKGARKKASKRRSTSSAKSKRVPAASGEIVRTSVQTVSKRLLGPGPISGGQSSSDGIRYSDPAREAMLRRLRR